MKLPELLERQFVLPSIPKVVALLLTELGRPDVDLRKVTRLISTDPALTTRLLQLANSGHFKLGGTISSVSEALALLNLDHVKTMAQAAATGASIKAVPGIHLARREDSHEIPEDLVREVLVKKEQVFERLFGDHQQSAALMDACVGAARCLVD